MEPALTKLERVEAVDEPMFIICVRHGDVMPRYRYGSIEYVRLNDRIRHDPRCDGKCQEREQMRQAEWRGHLTPGPHLLTKA